MNWLDGPLAGADLETTGVQVETARIVTACVGFAKRPGDWKSINWLIDPGIEIPEAASAIHGVTTEMAQKRGAAPQDALIEITDAIYHAWSKGAPLIGYNIIFDLTILEREYRRHDLGEFKIEGPVIDAMVIDKMLDPYRKGSRKLVDTCAHHGIPLTEAHTADADCFAAVRLAWVIIQQGQYRGKRLADTSLADLHALQVGMYTRQRESFHAYLARKGEQPDDPNTVWPIKPYASELAGVES